MAKSSLSAKKALPGGVSKGASFTKRNNGVTKSGKGAAGRSLKSGDADFGPRQVGNIGSTSGDDGAGTRSTAGLPAQTTAMAAPKAELPSAVESLAAATLPVPSANSKLLTVEPWDVARDAKLGKKGSR